jgi:four helix bundle protein
MCDAPRHAACIVFGMSTDHRTLKAFHMADEFAIRVYTATRSFHADERFGMRSQIRRAAVSIPTNIVEGCARDSDREHLRFYEIAPGSSREAIYLLSLAGRLELMDRGVAEELIGVGDRVAGALGALRKSIRAHD